MQADPDDAAAREAYRQKLRSLAFGAPHKNTQKTTPVIDDHTGNRVGRQVEHWSGRVDAVAEQTRGTVHPAVAEAYRNLYGQSAETKN